MLSNLSVEQSLMKAKSHAKKGELAEAQKLYEVILKNFSNNVRAQQGLAALNKPNQNNIIQNRLEEVIDQLVSLYNQGQITTVIKQAEILTEQYPNSPVIWNILGASRAKIGMLDEAIDAYKKSVSLNPDFAEAYSNMGVALKNQDKLDESIEAFKKSILLKPNDADSYYNMGITLNHQGKVDETISAYKKAISLNPDFAKAYNNLGLVLQVKGMSDEAIEACKKAISLNPHHAEAYNSLGIALQDKGKSEEALEAYKKAISLKPDYTEVLSNIGNILKDQVRLEEAFESYNKALLLKPNDADIYYNLANILHDLGRLDEAEFNFRQAMLFRPDFAEAHHNLSFTLLNNGKLKEGLDQLEWRWKNPEFLSSKERNFLQPQWDGIQSLHDKRILLWCEQGIGDTLNWSSCLSILASKAKHCILECQEKLVPLLTRSFPNIEIKAENRSRDIERDDFDCHLPMGSLYKHFLDDIIKNPNPDAYLVPDPDRVNYWKERLKSLGNGPYIGIAWKSSVTSHYRSLHYPSISEWSPVLSIPEVTFINLQYKDYADDLAKVKDEFGVTVHNFEDLDQWNNIDDVVALCAALDMNITTKVTPMIFSSAVGTPTKIANLRQSIFNTILNNPVGPSVDIYNRNTWEPWDNTFVQISKEICKYKNKVINCLNGVKI